MEMSFACKRFPIDQVLRCSFGLTPAELRVLKLLLRSAKSTEDLAETMGKDRTTVQRTVGSLLRKGLVARRQYNLDGGGYQYEYRAIEKEAIKARVTEYFNTFSRAVKEEIERW